jgi:drug/metabolite transporter (DMT)-like permease
VIKRWGRSCLAERRTPLSWPALWATIIWGFSFIATKIALKELSPFTLTAVRFGIGGLLLLLVQVHQNRNFFKAFSGKDWLHVLLLAVVGVAGHSLLQSYGLLYTTAIDTGWIIAVYPIFITIGGRLFLGEIITRRKVAGIALGFLGVFLIISKGKCSFSLFQSASTFGDLLILGSAFTWTAFTVGGRGFLSKYSSLSAMTPIMIVGFLITLPFSGGIGGWTVLFHLSLSAWASVLFLGILCSGLAFLFWYSALEKVESSMIGVYLYLEPFVTLIAAFLFLDESVEWITLFGGGLTLLGVYLTTRTFTKKTEESKQKK